jgi:hypothetical protein
MLGDAMSIEFSNAIQAALAENASIEEIVGILRAYRRQGMSAKSAAEVLEAIRINADEKTEDRILEILDIVTGFCPPERRVWN